tara:strand:- start:72 stop:509 length:438 start_codon:yes stop_codon:yes gene_type:complete
VANCNPDDYYISEKNYATGFQNNRREISTTLSKADLELLFYETNISCKDVLVDFFYCNICFNNDSNYLISFNGNKFNLNNENNPMLFTNNVINLIKSMKMGAQEYDDFLKKINNNFSKKEELILKKHFKNQKKDSIIPTIKIKTH